jgi:hypothetical protein
MIMLDIMRYSPPKLNIAVLITNDYKYVRVYSTASRCPCKILTYNL